ncbi:MAG: energy-coupling factor transporter transmembrane protein EcfT [Coriobacteriia bacterium]|nr:energy-coupling factor transporter transmembrane protein EcfT [Coriobacteriia bacterium]
MRPPVPFGQYVPIDSPVHRRAARAKMILVVSYTVLLFTSSDFRGLLLAAAFAFGAIAVSRVPLRLVLRGLRAVSILLAFTFLAHALRWNPATVTLVRIGPIGVDPDGAVTGLFFVARIMLLVVGTSLLTLTTSPVDLTDALERLFSPMRRLRVPVDDIAMMLTVALRFIPTTAEEAEKVIVAQAARGARFNEGSLLKRARAYVPVLVPLFVGLFRRADELAIAMESRCYRGGEGRTRLKESVLTGRDWLVMIVGTGLMAAGAVVL